jgi:hypothetical protein
MKRVLYFWRNYDVTEIVLIEERDGRLLAFELKWNPKKKSVIPKSFLVKYIPEHFQLINKENLHLFK